ncbi:MAG: ArnT family glycosyltransferase, partial [Bacteroidota bacterium]
MTEKYPLIEKNASLVYLIAYAALLFIPFIGSVHLFDWDEINFAESAREMLVTRDYLHVQINFTPFWEKPPFFFWLQALSMKVFGVNEFAARFPNALCGIVTLASLFYIGKREASRNMAIWWVLFMAGSFTPHLYYKSGIIDPWFNLFIFLSLYQCIKASSGHTNSKTDLNYVYAGLFAGMAFITKGPVALLVIGLCVLVFIAFNRFRFFFSFRQLMLGIIPFVFIASVWVAAEINQNGFQVLIDFINYQIDLFKNPVAGHGQPFYYHALVLLAGCFPASLFFLSGVRLGYIEPDRQHFFRWMSILFWVVLVLFSSVTTKIVHY